MFTNVLIVPRTSSHIFDLIFDSFSSHEPHLQKCSHDPADLLLQFRINFSPFRSHEPHFQIFPHDPTHDSTDSNILWRSRSRSSSSGRRVDNEEARPYLLMAGDGLLAVVACTLPVRRQGAKRGLNELRKRNNGQMSRTVTWNGVRRGRPARISHAVAAGRGFSTGSAGASELSKHVEPLACAMST